MGTSETGTITLRILAADLASGKIGTFIGNMDKMAKKGGLMQGVGRSLGEMLNPLGLVTDAIGAVSGYMIDAARAAMENEASVTRLTTSLKANVVGWDGNTAAIEQNILAQQHLGFTDDELRASLTLLVGATHDLASAQRIQATAMDLARYKGIGLKEASDALIKVEAGQYRALKALGIQLEKGATQTQALAAVQGVAAGQAEAWSKSTEGSLAAMNVAMGELQEDIGRGLLPVVMELSRAIREMAGTLSAGDPAVTAFIANMRILKDTGGQSTDWLKSFADGLVALDDILQPQVDEAMDFARSVQTMGEAANVSGRKIAELFFAFKDLEGLGSDAAKAAVIDYLQGIIDGADKATPLVEGMSVALTDLVARWMEIGSDATWPQTVADQLAMLKDNAHELVANFDRLPPEMQDAIRRAGILFKELGGYAGPAVARIEADLSELTGIVKGSLKDARNEAKTGMADLVWALRHPMQGAKLEAFYGEQVRKGTRAMNRALASGNAAAYAKAAKFVADYKAKLRELRFEDFHVRVQMDFISRTGSIPGLGADPGPSGVEAGPRWSAGPSAYGRGAKAIGGGVNIHFHGMLAAPSEADGQRIARMILPSLQRAQRGAY